MQSYETITTQLEDITSQVKNYHRIYSNALRKIPDVNLENLDLNIKVNSAFDEVGICFLGQDFYLKFGYSALGGTVVGEMHLFCWVGEKSNLRHIQEFNSNGNICGSVEDLNLTKEEDILTIILNIIKSGAGIGDEIEVDHK